MSLVFRRKETGNQFPARCKLEGEGTGVLVPGAALVFDLPNCSRLDWAIGSAFQCSNGND